MGGKGNGFDVVCVSQKHRAWSVTDLTQVDRDSLCLCATAGRVCCFVVVVFIITVVPCDLRRLCAFVMATGHKAALSSTAPQHTIHKGIRLQSALVRGAAAGQCCCVTFPQWICDTRFGAAAAVAAACVTGAAVTLVV